MILACEDLPCGVHIYRRDSYPKSSTEPHWHVPQHVWHQAHFYWVATSNPERAYIDAASGNFIENFNGHAPYNRKWIPTVPSPFTRMSPR